MSQRLLTICQRFGYIVIALPDTVSMDNYVSIEREINGLMRGAGDRIVLDLSNTTTLYSSGLGMLIRLYKKIADAGGTVCLVNVSARIRSMLAAVHLDKKMPCYATDVEFEISQDEPWRRELVPKEEISFGDARDASAGSHNAL